MGEELIPDIGGAAADYGGFIHDKDGISALINEEIAGVFRRFGYQGIFKLCRAGIFCAFAEHLDMIVKEDIFVFHILKLFQRAKLDPRIGKVHERDKKQNSQGDHRQRTGMDEDK